MLRMTELREFAREASRRLSREGDIAQYEIYASSAEHRIARLCYTSDIPCRGVEEMKSIHADGFQVRIVTRRDAHEIGTAFEAGDLSLDALGAAVNRARRAAVVDPHFPGFARDAKKPVSERAAASDLARASDATVAGCAWRVLEGALGVFRRSEAAVLAHPGLVLGGDVSIIRDRIAIAGSNLAGIRSDQSAHFSSSVTALVESLDAKGTASAVGTSVAAMRRAAAVLGRDALRRALALQHGERPPSGAYRVVLGPQPVAEILNYMVMGSLTTGAFHAASSAYHGRFGERVMDSRLTLADDPGARGGGARRTITCEGLAARRADLIRDGVLVGLLSTVYDSHRLETDEGRAEKLGARGTDAKFPPTSGYRLGEGGGRRFDASPAASGTNVIMRARGGVSDRDLLRTVGDGIYIGRIWYTYPINGQRAGDFTCTVSGDSYLIRNGELAEPLAPNSLRINANIAQVLESPIAVGAKPQPAIVWGAAESYLVPAIAADRIELAEVGAGG